MKDTHNPYNVQTLTTYTQFSNQRALIDRNDSSGEIHHKYSDARHSVVEQFAICFNVVGAISLQIWRPGCLKLRKHQGRQVCESTIVKEGGNYDLQSDDGRMGGSLNARMTAVGILYIAV